MFWCSTVCPNSAGVKCANKRKVLLRAAAAAAGSLSHGRLGWQLGLLCGRVSASHVCLTERGKQALHSLPSEASVEGVPVGGDPIIVLDFAKHPIFFSNLTRLN